MITSVASHLCGDCVCVWDCVSSSPSPWWGCRLTEYQDWWQHYCHYLSWSFPASSTVHTLHTPTQHQPVSQPAPTATYIIQLKIYTRCLSIVPVVGGAQSSLSSSVPGAPRKLPLSGLEFWVLRPRLPETVNPLPSSTPGVFKGIIVMAGEGGIILLNRNIEQISYIIFIFLYIWRNLLKLASVSLTSGILSRDFMKVIARSFTENRK